MNTTNTLGKTKQRKKPKVCKISTGDVLQTIKDAKTGPDAFECVRHDIRIKQHYDHAREKHPYFCDRLLPDWSIGEIKSSVAVNLECARIRINAGVRDHNLMWNEIADCEVWEATEAMANGDKAHAVEELYDCIAVLLRTIDVLEGRQKLGKHETISGTSAGKTQKKENNNNE